MWVGGGCSLDTRTSHRTGVSWVKGTNVIPGSHDQMLLFQEGKNGNNVTVGTANINLVLEKRKYFKLKKLSCSICLKLSSYIL